MSKSFGHKVLAVMVALWGLQGAGADTSAIEKHDPLPLVFEQNVGQLDGPVDFLARGKGFSISLSRGSASLFPSGESGLMENPLRLELIGGNESPIGSGLMPLPGRVNYIQGRDPSQWRLGVPLYERARYEHVYPGIDAVYYPNKGDLEYDFIVSAGADYRDIRIQFTGARSVTVNDDGSLSLDMGEGVMLQHAPVCYQEVNGRREPVEGRYLQHADGTLGFELGAFNPELELVIDPVLTYASYFPGSAFDLGAGVAVPAFGGGRPPFYTCGSTEGLSLTATNIFGTPANQDIYVARMDPYSTGVNTLTWLTIIGGSGTDTATDILHYQATEGYLFISGTTDSADLPVVDGPDPTFNDGVEMLNTDAFLLVLQDSGDNLEALTYVGGTGKDTGTAIINSNGRIYLTGETSSSDLPIVGAAFQSTLTIGATVDTYLTMYDFSGLSSLALNYASYLGSENSRPHDIALTAFDKPAIVGQTGATLTVKASFQGAPGGGSGLQPDAFVCQWDLTQSVGSETLTFSSYLGGSGNDLALGATAIGTNIYVVGATSSSDFPSNFGQALSGPQDGFVARIAAGIPNASLNWTVLYGGDATDDLSEVAAIGSSGLYVAGQTDSTNGILLPSPQFDPISSILNGGDNTTEKDVWLLRLPDAVTTPPPSTNFSSYLGGSGSEVPSGIAIDAQQRVYLSGQTTSTDFPMSNAFKGSAVGAQEGFVAIVQEAIFVDAASPLLGIPCGDSWGQPCPSIEDGLAEAGNNGEIWVKAGTYTDAGIDTLLGQQFYGAFSGTESVRDKRDLVNNVTTVTPVPGNHAFSLQSQNRFDGFQFTGSTGNNGPLILSGVNNSTIANCYFYQNSPIEDGGGVYIEGGSTDIRILNCVFVDNTGERGGGIFMLDSSGWITNCTFAANTATVEATSSSLFFSSSVFAVEVSNCILWGAGGGVQQIFFDTNTPVVSNSIVEGGFAGTSVIDTDPLFVLNPTPGSSVGDVRLQDASPARDFGTDTSGSDTNIFSDIEGNKRYIQGTSCRYDAGAYESEIASPEISLLGSTPLVVEVNTSYTEPGATAQDGCSDDISGSIVIDDSALVLTALGDYNITYDVTDALGVPAAQVIRLVQVVDTTPPVIALTGGAVVLECGTAYVEPGFSASDNLDGDLTTSVSVTNPVDNSTPSTYTVRYNVSDSEGNDAIEVTRTVSVQDTTDPIILLTGANPVVLACGDTYVEPGVTASDTCDGVLTGSVNAVDNIDTATPGIYSVDYDVQDAEGNIGTASRSVEVQDNTDPVITLIGSAITSVACGDSYTDAGATASDNCDGDLSGSIIRNGVGAVNTSSPGDYLVTYDVQDGSGNDATQVVRTVRVTDTAPPVIALIGLSTIQVECRDAFIDPGATASDTCDGAITPVSTGSVNVNSPGVYTITYTASDLAGNAATPAQRTVEVVDTTAPVITLNGASVVTLECGNAYTELNTTTADNCDGDLSGSVTIAGDTVDTSMPGTYNLTYDVSDGEGNAATTVVRQVVVEDNAVPVITLNGASPLVLECGDVFTDPLATASDACDGDLSGSITLSGDTVDTSTPGSYAIQYDVSDGAGNAALSVVRTVTVEDNGIPVITMNASSPVFVECGGFFTDPGASAADDCEGALTVFISGDTVDTNVPGDYVIHYDAQDSSGNDAVQISRTVTVQDTKAPVISLAGTTDVVVECGSEFVEPGYTATDDCDGDLTGAVEVTVGALAKLVAELTPGNYEIVYEVSDAAGNSAIETRDLTVADTAPPVIALNGASVVNLSCGDAYTEDGAVATDTCEGDVAVTIGGDTVNPAVTGVYTITYDAADAEGNAAIQVVRTVNVLDNADPVINLVGDGVVTVECGSAYTELGATASDDCVVDLTGDIIIGGDVVDTTSPGTYTVQYSVTNDEGNATSIDRTVEVVDTTNPVVTLIGPASQTVQCGGGYVDPGVTATDNCDGDLTGNVIEELQKGVDPNVPGVYTLRYHVQDAAGNIGETFRTVTVVDTSLPGITLLGAADIIVACKETFTDPGATALDSCSGDLTNDIVVTGDVDTNTPGVYSLFYDVADNAGNNALRRTRTVTVQDAIAPVITRIGAASITIDCGQAYNDPGATATDSCVGDLTGSIERTGLVNVDAPGIYTLQYNVSDPAGNAAATVSRTVTVRSNCTAEGEGEGIVEGEGEGVVEGDGEGIIEGEGEGVVEGEGEGVVEGEGEGIAEGEGEADDIDCSPSCEGIPVVDEDGDGLSACEEDFFGTSDALTDTDGDGMADSFEARYCPDLNPTDPADAFEDTDGDTFDNIDEFLRGSDPLDPESPSNNFFVAPFAAGGRDESGRGDSPSRPWATIGFALSQVTPTPTDPVNIVLANGTYTESFAMKPGVAILAMRGAQPVIVGTIVGAESCALFDLIIAPRLGPVTLLSIDNAAMRIVRCLFRGPSRRDSTGILITGNRARDVVIEQCVFERLAFGIDVDAGHPALRLSFFEKIATAGIIIRCPEGDESFSQFDGSDARVGFNTFSPDLEVPAVINECPVEANMERNDWGVIDPPTPETVDGVIEGAVNFKNFLSLGGALFAGSLFCTVWDAADQAPILNARISIVPLSAGEVTDNEAGVYAFPALSSGNYTLSVSAPGYDTKQQVASVSDGQLASVIVALRFNGQVEEGEGEGEEPPPPGCQCNQGNKLAPLQPGDMMLSMLLMATLAISTFTLRRESKRAWR